MPPPSPATKQERALLLFTLENPLHEKACCARAMVEIVHKVFTVDKKPEDDPRQAPLLRAAMTFISGQRSDEEHAALLERLLNCQCSPRIAALHGPTNRPPAAFLERFLWVICSTICDYFRRLGPGKFRKAKANTTPEMQPWPNCIEDLIPAPSGEQGVLGALLQWAIDVPAGYSVFVLMGALARFWEPFAIQLFKDTGVFPLATSHLKRALQSYHPHLPNQILKDVFVCPVTACANALFLTLSELDMRSCVLNLRSVYEDMYAIAVPIEPILLRLRQEESMDDCRRWFSLVRALRRGIAPDGSFITNPKGKAKSKMPEHTHFGGAHHCMVEIRNRNQCLHVQCKSKIQARSLVCSRCGIVRYCTPECLKAAWTAPRLPHKSLCQRITALRAAVLLTDNKAWNHTVRDDSNHRQSRQFMEKCIALGADPRVAEAIWRGISVLTEARAHFLWEMDHAEQELKDATMDRVEGAGPKEEEDVIAEPQVDHTDTLSDKPLPDEEVD
ncbi:hypothetical protein DFH06DRAFT_730995 [Mycena polygramma]|nr:hypothetical protein DFH06DRAFT_730995 [Mycena polygramma]